MHHAFCVETKEEAKKHGRKAPLNSPLPWILQPAVTQIASAIMRYF